MIGRHAVFNRITPSIAAIFVVSGQGHGRHIVLFTRAADCAQICMAECGEASLY